MKPNGLWNARAICLLQAALVCCSTPPQVTDPASGDSLQPEWPVLTGPYLGQSPPGSTPRRFVPDALAANAAWFFHGVPAFSRDGSEMYFVRYPTDESQRMGIRVTRQVAGSWSEPQRAPFSSDLAENSPAFSIDGNRLFYVSELPADRHKFVTRSGDGWSSPQSVSIPVDPSAYPGWQLSITRNETLYFELQFDGHYDLYASLLIDGEYAGPQSLGPQVNSDYNDFAPFVDTLTRTMSFSRLSDRAGWGKAICTSASTIKPAAGCLRSTWGARSTPAVRMPGRMFLLTASTSSSSPHARATPGSIRIGWTLG